MSDENKNKIEQLEETIEKLQDDVENIKSLLEIQDEDEEIGRAHV